MGVYEDAVTKLMQGIKSGKVPRDIGLTGEKKSANPADYYYTAEETWKNAISWELSCALITRKWSRVRNALIMLSKPPRKVDDHGSKQEISKAECD